MTCGGTPAPCARCKVNPRVHSQTGCLCQPCEDAIEGMTQEQLDADYRARTADTDPHAGIMAERARRAAP